MSDKLITIDSVSDLHKELGLDYSKHALVSLIQHDDNYRQNYYGNKYLLNIYSIILKYQVPNVTSYGRDTSDSGCVIFLSPGQISTSGNDGNNKNITGWTLAIHPDLLKNYKLGSKIDQYSFFSYEFFESLYLSLEEKIALTKFADNLEQEINLGESAYSEYLIASTIELLLDYCHRYYRRQFDHAAVINTDLRLKFYNALNNYYDTGKQLTQGVPDVSYFGCVLHMSPYYLSDLLKKETGKTASEHISQYVVELAKTKLLNTSDPINKIAFNLGFNYHQHFSKMFRRKTGLSPIAYRQSN